MKHKLLKVLRSHCFKLRVHTGLELSLMPTFGVLCFGFSEFRADIWG
jgi:hypothetical protein